MANTNERYDVAIVGSGPAGLTAAIYCARARMSLVCIEGTSPGGQLMTTTDVENYPGFAEGVMGPDLMEEMRKQAARFGTEFLPGDAVSADFSTENRFHLTTDRETEIEARSVILATGARPRLLGLEAEDRLFSKGLSTCATCDGAFFRGEELIVVGGGDSAMEEGIFLTRFADKVTIVHRRDELRASKILAERAKENPKIDWLWSHVLVDLKGENRVEEAVLKNLKTDEVFSQPIGGVFYAIGHIPNTRFLEGQVDLDDDGYIEVRDNVFTSQPGVFTGGDCHDHRYRQAVTAAGLGCMAALETERYLESLDD